MDKGYVETVRLLLETAPEVFRGGRFAMKGGTALNLFVQDMPRLSVDIDVVYLDHRTGRDSALEVIRSELTAIRQRLHDRGMDSEIASSRRGDETKLFARRGRQQVKIEINHVFRGSLLPPELRSLSKTASDLFTTALTAPTLAVPELYGSKLVATLDRQHPRDLFDVVGMYHRLGLTPDIVDCFVCYLAGHNRPVHEVLYSRDIPLESAFEGDFAGMEREPIDLGELQAIRSQLRADLIRSLTENHRRFLLGLVAGAPPWEVMPFPHLPELPAMQWKLQNLAKLRKSNPGKFQMQTHELQRQFGQC